MSRIEDGAPILFVGRKGPVDWVCHKASSATSDGNAAAACSDKGARRAMTLPPEHLLYITPCPACWPQGVTL